MIKAKVAPRRKATPLKNGADRRERKRRALVKRLGEEAAKKAIRLALVSKSLLKSGLGVKSFSEVLAEVRARRVAQRFVRESREKYLEAISLALALYYAVQTDQAPTASLQKLVEETGQKVTKRTSATQIVLRVVIDYGKTDKEKRESRKIVSRDAAALDYLIQYEISPNQVVALGKKRGGGLEAWARAGQSRTKCKPKRSKTSSDDKLWDGHQFGAEDQWDDELPTKENLRDNDRRGNEHPRDERSAGRGIGKIAIVPEQQIKFIKAIENRGHLICRAEENDKTAWALIAFKLTAPDSNPQLSRTLAKALGEYADRLIRQPS